MKRARSPSPTGLARLFDLPELFLHILSFLEPADLARIQGVNTHWQRMAGDPELWRRLYLRKHAHPHAPPHTAFTHPRTRRPIARLPSRAFPPPSPTPSRDEQEDVRFDGVDWKALLRLGTNWSNGNVLAETAIPLPPLPAPALQDQETSSTQLLALFPSFIARASASPSPLVHIHSASGMPLGLIPPPPGWSSPARPDNVTAVVADSAVAPAETECMPARLGIFYASGGFAVVRLRLTAGRLAWTREAVGVRGRAPRRGSLASDPVVLAAMHFSLLLTCTRSFRLAVYSLEGEPTLIRALRSDVSFHPAALTLVPTPTGFRGELTFSTPVYPSAWTVAVQELHIPLSPLAVHRGECHHVRPALTPATDWPRRIEPVRAVRGPAGVGSDGRWCVLAGADSVMHVYALPRKHEGMVHAHTLLAPPGGVGALALAAGRCVSGGKAGARVLLWDLEEVGGEAGEAQVGTARAGYVEVRAGGRRRTEAEEVTAAQTEEGEVVFPNPRSISAAARALFLPAPPASLPAAPSVVPASGRIQQLAFDEEKIVGMEGDVMRIWSFR